MKRPESLLRGSVGGTTVRYPGRAARTKSEDAQARQRCGRACHAPYRDDVALVDSDPPRSGQPGNRRQGFTVLELMLAILIVGILAMLAIGQYSNYQERVLVGQAIHDIASISLEIQQMAAFNGRLPVDLAEVGHGGALDPWGNAYVYTDLTGPGNGAARKDRRLNPLNSDFDLFSKGKDGVFKPQISHRDSLDDVIRASDGRFIDLAEKY